MPLGSYRQMNMLAGRRKKMAVDAMNRQACVPPPFPLIHPSFPFPIRLTSFSIGPPFSTSGRPQKGAQLQGGGAIDLGGAIDCGNCIAN
eukprot:1670043-Pyramimonas_sp.AAC.1